MAIATVRKHDCEGYLKKLFKEETEEGLRLFLLYYCVPKGHKDALVWASRQWDGICAIRRKVVGNRRQWQVCPPLEFLQLNGWIRELVRRYGKEIEEPAELLRFFSSGVTDSTQWRSWYQKHKDRLRWDEGMQMYVVE